MVRGADSTEAFVDLRDREAGIASEKPCTQTFFSNRRIRSTDSAVVEPKVSQADAPISVRRL